MAGTTTDREEIFLTAKKFLREDELPRRRNPSPQSDRWGLQWPVLYQTVTQMPGSGRHYYRSGALDSVL